MVCLNVTKKQFSKKIDKNYVNLIIKMSQKKEEYYKALNECEKLQNYFDDLTKTYSENSKKIEELTSSFLNNLFKSREIEELKINQTFLRGQMDLVLQQIVYYTNKNKRIYNLYNFIFNDIDIFLDALNVSDLKELIDSLNIEIEIPDTLYFNEEKAQKEEIKNKLYI